MSHSAGVAHENGDCWPPNCPACAAEDVQESRLFVCDDGYGDPCVWERTTFEPVPVLHRGDVGDDALWDAIVKLVVGGVA